MRDEKPVSNMAAALGLMVAALLILGWGYGFDLFSRALSGTTMETAWNWLSNAGFYLVWLAVIGAVALNIVYKFLARREARLRADALRRIQAVEEEFMPPTGAPPVSNPIPEQRYSL